MALDTWYTVNIPLGLSYSNIAYEVGTVELRVKQDGKVISSASLEQACKNNPDWHCSLTLGSRGTTIVVLVAAVGAALSYGVIISLPAGQSQWRFFPIWCAVLEGRCGEGRGCVWVRMGHM